jgi:DNA-binding NarL/FixJ family response regulator
MRETLTEVFQTSGIEVAFSAGDPAEFLSRLGEARPDVALVDLTLESAHGTSLPSGLTALGEIQRWHPNVRVVVLSGARAPEVVERCYQHGAAGYLYKLTSNIDTLVSTVQAVARGERLALLGSLRAVASESSGGHAEAQLGALTHREREVLAYVGGGADNLKIATHLKITERTVKAHVSALYRKLGPENRAQLALLARQLGIQPPMNI